MIGGLLHPPGESRTPQTDAIRSSVPGRITEESLSLCCRRGSGPFFGFLIPLQVWTKPRHHGCLLGQFPCFFHKASFALGWRSPLFVRTPALLALAWVIFSIYCWMLKRLVVRVPSL
ncbi:hypothetical protein BDV10DRAFT_171472 [Aspergillus recurvatus]